MILKILHGEGVDPTAAFLSLGLPPNFTTHDDHYAVEIDEAREADFRAALKLDPASIYAARARAEAKVKAREAATARIEAVWPAWKQANAALGVYGDAVKAECVAFIQSIRDGTDVLDAKIEAAPDRAAIQALDLTFKA